MASDGNRLGALLPPLVVARLLLRRSLELHCTVTGNAPLQPMESNVPTVEPLDVTVSLATLPSTALPHALYHVLQLVLFSIEEPRFLSISVVEMGQITIVAEVAELASLKEHVPELVLDDIQWAVVRVAEGSSGYESVGVVERLTEPLAKQRIPVLYTSTYSMDFCLIPQDRLEEAIGCLYGDSAREAPIDAAAASAAENSTEDSAPRHTHPLTVMDGTTTHIVRLEKQHRHRHTGALLRLLFMPHAGDAPQAISSLTETSDEISLIVGDAAWWAEYCRGTPDSGLSLDPHEGWVPIRVGDEHGTPLEETGVIASQAKVLADANLSILYVSTFWSDFTLVQRADVEQAEKAFGRRGFRCSRSSSRLAKTGGSETETEE